jgi:hypothetical protein
VHVTSSAWDEHAIARRHVRPIGLRARLERWRARLATRIATAVAVQAVADGVAPEKSDDEVAKAVRAARWAPEYR